MSTSPDPSVQALIERVCLGLATESEADRLERLIAQDAGVRALYVRTAQLDGALRWRHRSNHPGRARVQTQGATRPGPRLITRWAAMAAAVLVTAVLGAWVVNGMREKPLAIVLFAHNAQWAGENAPVPGDALELGELSLVSGSVAIEYASGIIVEIFGGSVYRLESETRAFLERGRVRGYVPDGAEGFVVASPTANVIDLGTKFQMRVHDEGTQVEVNTGRVRVESVGLDGDVVGTQDLYTGKVLNARRGGGLRVDPAQTMDWPIAAGPVVVVNPSFEHGCYPASSDPKATIPIGWNATLARRVGAEDHLRNGNFTSGVTGKHVAIINAAHHKHGDPRGIMPTLYQDTSEHVDPNAVYTLAVSIGRRADADRTGKRASPWRIALVDAQTGRVLAEESGELRVAGMYEMALTYRPTPADAGAQIQIRLACPTDSTQGGPIQTNFDQVRLNVERSDAPPAGTDASPAQTIALARPLANGTLP